MNKTKRFQFTVCIKEGLAVILGLKSKSTSVVCAKTFRFSIINLWMPIQVSLCQIVWQPQLQKHTAIAIICFPMRVQYYPLVMRWPKMRVWCPFRKISKSVIFFSVHTTSTKQSWVLHLWNLSTARPCLRPVPRLTHNQPSFSSAQSKYAAHDGTKAVQFSVLFETLSGLDVCMVWGLARRAAFNSILVFCIPWHR